MPCNCCEMENNTFGEDEAKANLKDYIANEGTWKHNFVTV